MKDSTNTTESESFFQVLPREFQEIAVDHFWELVLTDKVEDQKALELHESGVHIR